MAETSSYLAKALANRQSGGSTGTSSYLAKALANRPATSKLDTTKLTPLNLGETKGHQSTLGWLVDILSRPMRAIENIPNQTLNEIAKIQKEGANYNIWGGIGNVLTSPTRGFFSNNPEDQPTGSQLIEKATDVFGAYDPNYVNTQDNVNPWVKGIGGFALDVGLDPLTYIPGAQFAKAGQIASKGIKGLVAGADAAVAGTNLGKTLGAAARTTARATAAEEAAKATVIAENLAKQRELLDVVVNAPSMRLTTAENPVLSQLLVRGEAPVQSGIKLGESVAPTSNVLESLIQKFGKSEGAVTGVDRRTLPRTGAVPAASKTADEAASLMEGVAKSTAPVAEQMAAKGAVPSILEALTKIEQSVSVPTTAARTADFDARFLQEQVDDFTRQIDGAQKNIALIEGKLGRASDMAYERGQKTIAELQKKIKAAQSGLAKVNKQVEAGAAKAAVTEKAFSENVALTGVLKNPETVAALGPKATEYLAGIKNAKGVVKASQELGKMLTGQTPVDQITKWGTGASDVLAKHVYSHHGVDVPGTNVARIQGESLVKTPIVGEAQVAKAAGETLADNPWLANISEQNIDELIQDMPVWIKDDFVNLEGKNWTTKTAVKVNHPEKGIWTGEGIRPYELNQVDQNSMATSLMRRNIDELERLNAEYKAAHPGKGAKYAGIQRANSLMLAAIEKVSEGLKWMDTKGASAWMGIGESRIRLYWHQMVGTLNRISVENGSDALKIAMFNRETGVPMNNIADAVVAVHANPALSEAKIIEILKYKAPNSKADNFLTGGKDGIWRHYTARPKDGRKVIPNPNNPGFYGVITPEQLANDLAITIKQSADDITRIVADNEMMAAQRVITEERDMSLAVMDDIASYALDIDRFGDSVRAAANPVSHAGATGAKNFAGPQAQNAAGKISTDYLPADLIHDAQFNVAMGKAQKLPSAEMVEKFKQLGIKETQYQTKLAAEIVELNKLIEDGYSAAGKLVDPMARSIATGEQTMNNMMEGLFTNKLRKFFDITYGTKNVVHQYARGRGALMNGLGSYRMGLGNIIRKHDGMFTRETPIVNQAFRDIASGADNAATTAARADLLPFIKEVFGDPKDLNMPGLWEKAGASLDDIEIYMRKAGLDFPIDRSIAKEQAKFYGGSELKAGLDQWKIWAKNIDDPVQFLAESQYAAAMLHTDRVTAHLFTQVPDAVSKVPKAGYVKLADDLNAFDNPFLANLPKGIHVRAEFVEEIKRIEETAMANRTFNGPFGKWINDKYMPMLNIWKRGVTIMRPGHHFRNLLSSESIQFVREGTQYYMRSGKSAIRVLAAHKAYKDVDWAKMVDEMGDLKMPTGDTHIFTLGDGTKISAEAINEAATKHGIYTNYRAMEDLFTDSAPRGKVVEFLDKATGGGTKVEQFAGGVSEMQAHFSRLHHFNQILMKEAKKMKKGDWEKVVEKAAIKVRQSHPDSIMLASGEAKLRAVIPFYTWFRLVMPVIAQSMAMNPGRFMVMPKASYNMAVAMGVNPQSMQDPFPANKLFPDFITNQLTGPVANFGGNYFTASPGFAYADILNQFVADPKKGLIGMITPAVKIPGELITGTKWDSGSKINDYSDYVDSSIPFINYASNISGVSATGSVVSLLSGQGVDPQYAVSKGSKTPIDQIVTATNWFTGWGVQNISKSSYTNLAEIQKRNKAAQAEKERQGTARSAF